jgi:hypothetical protein
VCAQLTDSSNDDELDDEQQPPPPRLPKFSEPEPEPDPKQESESEAEPKPEPEGEVATMMRGYYALAALTIADGVSTIMHALAATLGIGGKWKPKEFLEKAAAHLGRPVPPGKVRAAHRV